MKMRINIQRLIVGFIRLLCACSIGSTICTPAHSFAKRTSDAWVYYHFDGNGFRSGPATNGTAIIAVRELYQPVVLQNQLTTINAPSLSHNSGVIVGICYFQSSGGKLSSSATYMPCPNALLEISFAGKQLLTVKTDENGYFAAVLEPGTYSIGSGPLTTEITVESGKTTLVPLRAGKRMVD